MKNCDVLVFREKKKKKKWVDEVSFYLTSAYISIGPKPYSTNTVPSQN